MSKVGELSALSELVQQAEQLTAAVDSSGQLPRVERNLRQLAEAGQQLWSRTAAQTAAHDVRAAILLGARGVDVPAMTQRLEALGQSLAETTTPTPPAGGGESVATDVAGFLRAERENAVLAVIERSSRDTWQMVDDKHWASFQQHWHGYKQRLLEELSTVTSLPGGDLDSGILNVPLQQPIITDSSSAVDSSVAVGGARSSLTAVETAYADQVRRWVDTPEGGSGTGEKRTGLMQMCRDAMRPMSEPVADELWSSVSAIAELRVSGAGVSKERASSSSFSSQLLDSALHLLQSEQLQRVRQQVYASLRGARLGGVPSVRQLIQSYLAVCGSRAACVGDRAQCDGVSGWALVFHCLRCGDPAAARDSALASRPPLSDVARWLQERASSVDGAISTASETSLRLQYRRCCSAGGGASDPYERVVLAVLGACAGESPTATDPLADLPATTSDDWLWFRLACVRALATRSAQTAALSQLQQQLRVQLGESHFDAYNQPLIYFRVLLLSGQLEAAVAFLSRVERLRVHAVHIGLALQEASLLQLTDTTGTSQHDTTAVASQRLSLVRVILAYTRRFERGDPVVALYYLAAARRVHAFPGDSAARSDALVRAIADLARASGELAVLLGRVSADGAREPGLVERLGLEEDAARRLVASECEQRGELEEAAQLYDLAGNRLHQLQLLCQLLSEVAAQPPDVAAAEGQGRRERVLAAAAAAVGRFQQLSGECQRQINTLRVLLDLATFFQLVHTGRPADALHVMHRLRLVSMSSEQLESRLHECGRLEPEVLRLVPDTLLATMQALHALVTAAVAAGDSRAAEQARQQASALLTFAGSVPYRLPGDTHARLTRIDALMN